MLSRYQISRPTARQQRNQRYYNRRLNSDGDSVLNKTRSKTPIKTVDASYSASEIPASPLSPSAPPPIAHASADAPVREEPAHKRIGWSAETGFTGVIESDYASFRTAYPACDVPRQISAADLWLRANPRKSKKKNLFRFLTNWLERQQERGGDEKSTKRENGNHSRPHRQAPAVTRNTPVPAGSPRRSLNDTAVGWIPGLSGPDSPKDAPGGDGNAG